jgi:hypothetical protein
MAGVFVTRGMTVVIPKAGLTLSIDEKGKVVDGSVTVHVHYDVCPTWLDLAARHLSDARERKLLRVAAWSSNDEKAKGETLEKEFESSMQAIMAAAIAIDSFYAALRDKTNIPKDTVKKWQENSTARYKQITEIIRRAFSLSPRRCVTLRNFLKEMFRVRDLAVHPSGNIGEPVLHPELDTGVEWRFEVFRADTAEAVVRTATNVIHELVTKGTPANADVRRYTEGLKGLLFPTMVEQATPETE